VLALAGCGAQHATATPAAATLGPTVTVTAPAHTTTAPPTKTATPAAPAPVVRTVYVPQQAPAPAAPALRYVGNGVYANASTSDAFALAVAAAFTGPGVQYVYSPVTGQSYAMTYQVVGAGTVIVTGGNNAYVQF
jgi:hypothetical protein